MKIDVGNIILQSQSSIASITAPTVHSKCGSCCGETHNTGIILCVNSQSVSARCIEGVNSISLIGSKCSFNIKQCCIIKTWSKRSCASISSIQQIGHSCGYKFRSIRHIDVDGIQPIVSRHSDIAVVTKQTIVIIGDVDLSHCVQVIFCCAYA